MDTTLLKSAKLELRSSTRWLTACEKISLEKYKAKLTKDQRKAFRSQMWAFRRDPASLSAEEKQALEALFEKLPALRPLYKVRLRFKKIFDAAPTESRPRG